MEGIRKEKNLRVKGLDKFAGWKDCGLMGRRVPCGTLDTRKHTHWSLQFLNDTLSRKFS